MPNGTYGGVRGGFISAYSIDYMKDQSKQSGSVLRAVRGLFI